MLERDGTKVSEFRRSATSRVNSLMLHRLSGTFRALGRSQASATTNARVVGVIASAGRCAEDPGAHRNAELQSAPASVEPWFGSCAPAEPRRDCPVHWRCQGLNAHDGQDAAVSFRRESRHSTDGFHWPPTRSRRRVRPSGTFRRQRTRLAGDAGTDDRADVAAQLLGVWETADSQVGYTMMVDRTESIRIRGELGSKTRAVEVPVRTKRRP